MFSVHDVESEAERSVEFGPFVETEDSNRFGIESPFRHGEDVVAVDDSGFGEAVSGAYFDF
jgi:hypothetical protein